MCIYEIVVKQIPSLNDICFGHDLLQELQSAGMMVPEDVIELLGVPREVYDGIASHRVGWAPIRQAVSSGLFVDSQRLMI